MEMNTPTAFKLDLSTVQLLSNFVLLKQTRGENDLKLSDGKVIYIDASYEKEKNAPSSAIVVAVPDKIHFSKKAGSLSAEYKTDVEIKSGDTVTFHYLCYSTCMEKKEYIVAGGEVYLLVKYDEIFFAKREGQIIPVNGWVFVEPTVETIETSIHLPEHLKKKKSLTSGTIRHIGSPLKDYLYDVYMEKGNLADTDELKVGDKVLFSKEDSLPIESELHATEKPYYRMQRRDILALVENF